MNKQTKINIAAVAAVLLIMGGVFCASRYKKLATKDNTVCVSTTYPMSSAKKIIFDPTSKSMWFEKLDDGIYLSKMNVLTGNKIDYTIDEELNDIVFDSATNSIWGTASGNKVSKIDATTGQKIVDYVTGDSSSPYDRSIVFDPITKSVWVTNPNFCDADSIVSKIDVNTGARVDYPTGGCDSKNIAFDPVTESIWVTNNFSDSVSKINIHTGARVVYATSHKPEKIVFDSTTNSVWVVNGVGDTISKVNIHTGAKTDYVAKESFTRDIAFDPITSSVWVTNSALVKSGTPGHTTFSNTYSVSKVDVLNGVKSDISLGAGFDFDFASITFEPVTNSVWITGTSPNKLGAIAKICVK